MKQTTIILLYILAVYPIFTVATIKRKKNSDGQILTCQNKKRKKISIITILANAIQKNDINKLELIIFSHPPYQRYALLNSPSAKGRFLLEYACTQGSRRAVSLLLSHGAQANALDNMGRTPLLAAAYRGSPNIVQLLLQNNVMPNAPEHSPSPLVLATQRYNAYGKYFYRVIKILLEHGADPNRLDHSGRSAYMQAALSNQIKLLNLMHRHNANPLKLSGNKHSALEYASYSLYRNTAQKMEQLINKKEHNTLKKYIKKQPTDLITGESLLSCSLSSLIVVGDILWQKEALIKHILYKIGTEKGPLDPFTNKIIPKEIIVRLAAYFKIPIQELTEHNSLLGQRPLVSIADSITRLESTLSISSSHTISANLSLLKTQFRNRLKNFNPELAKSVHS